MRRNRSRRAMSSSSDDPSKNEEGILKKTWDYIVTSFQNTDIFSITHTPFLHGLQTTSGTFIGGFMTVLIFSCLMVLTFLKFYVMQNRLEQNVQIYTRLAPENEITRMHGEQDLMNTTFGFQIQGDYSSYESLVESLGYFEIVHQFFKKNSKNKEKIQDEVVYKNLKDLLHNNTYGLPEIRVNKSNLKYSGSEDGINYKTDVVYSEVDLRLNFDKLYAEAFKRTDRFDIPFMCEPLNFTKFPKCREENISECRLNKCSTVL